MQSGWSLAARGRMKDTHGGAGKRWLDYLIPALLVGSFLALTAPFFDFFLDDAFIGFRYGVNLAEGHGFVWNPGADPVEGATNFLWALLAAVPAWLGLSVPGFMKTVSLAAGAGCIAGVYAAARHRGVTRWTATAASATMGLSPAFAILSLQGLGTSAAALLLLAATVASLEVVRSGRRLALAVLSISILLGGMIRPELLLYGAGLLAGTGWQVYRRQGLGEVRRQVVWVASLLVAPGAAYMAWRWSYFGYPLPNTFYTKQASTFNNVYFATDYLFGFVMLVLGPLAFLALWRLSRADDPVEQLAPLAGSLSGAGLMGVSLLGIAPVQAYHWRYQMPLLAPLALVLALVVQRLPIDEIRDWAPKTLRKPRTWLALALALALVTFPLHSFREVGDGYLFRHHGDRAAAGQALAPLADEQPRMFVTESGALPYYSDWISVDENGLTNETIAHEGYDVEFLERYDPDLVMTLVPARSGFGISNAPVVETFLQTNDYTLATGIEKTEHPDRLHLYFVDPGSPHAEEITCRLLSIESEDHVDRGPVIDHMGLGVEPADQTRESCPDYAA